MPQTIDDFRQYLAGLPTSMRAALGREMLAALQDVARVVQDDKLSGQVLRARSGRLRASIAVAVDEAGDLLSGTIGSDVPYAAIHEYGGTILRRQAATARSPRGQATIVEPERSYLRSTLAEQADGVRGRLTKAVMEAIDA